MLKKLELDQTKIYERYIALEQISLMLESFVNGKPHYQSIGAEQGDVDQWDDLVIRESDNKYIHIQVKRQTRDFSSDSTKRDKISKGKRKGELKDLSAFDKAIKSVGDRNIASEVDKNESIKEFWLMLPESSIEIKKGLQIRHFQNFCDVQIKGVTTPDGLANLAEKSKPVQKIFDWLTTWCDFIDWEHILRSFRILKIRPVYLEEIIIERAEGYLRRIFEPTEVETVRRLILSYLEENTTFTGAIMPRELLYQLKKYLPANVQRWTSFKSENSSWKISGIHDLEKNNKIERPNVIVPALWQNNNNYMRSLKVYGGCVRNCPVSNSLMRLALHPEGSFNIFCTEKSNWEEAIKSKVGGTLGITKRDFTHSIILGGSAYTNPTELYEVKAIDEKDDLAEKLHNEMHKETLKRIDDEISSEINDMSKGDLRIAIDKRWSAWKISLDKDVNEQRKLFSKILHPNLEGKVISGELRVGPRTAILLSEAIFLLLIVSVCLGDKDNEGWKSVAGNLKMNSIGLGYWSGPAGESEKVIEIDDDSYFTRLLEDEIGEIMIISKSKLSQSEAFSYNLADDNTGVGLMTFPRRPKLLITSNRTFNRALKTGDISEVKKHLEQGIDEYNRAVSSAKNKVVGG